MSHKTQMVAETRRKIGILGILMHPKFAEVVECLPHSFERLMTMEPLRGTPPSRVSTPKCGIYLFSEDDRHLYVGRSNRIAYWYDLHCGLSAKQNQASFAWKLMAESLATRRRTDGARAGPT